MADIIDVKSLDFVIDDDSQDLDFTIDDDDSLDFTIDPYINATTTDYNELINLPYINEVKVIGHKTGPDYGLQNLMDEITPQQIDIIIYG